MSFRDAAVARAVLAIACRIGSTRRIDDVVLGEDPAPRGTVVSFGRPIGRKSAIG